MNQTQQTPSFSVVLLGHELKYEVECILKLFIPATKFQFYYEDRMPLSAPQPFAAVQVRQGRTHTWFYAAVRWKDGKLFRGCLRSSRILPEEEKAGCEYLCSQLLFRLLQQATGLTPPWGLLTGIRPVRKIMPLLQAGMRPAEIVPKLADRYWIRRDKLTLAMRTAQVQRPLLEATPKNSVSLYVSIPFCPTRCSYCSFVSHSMDSARKLMPDYVRLLCRELELWGEIVQELGLTVDTIYFGGGTPTSLEAADLTRIMETIARCFDCSHLREYCVEAGRPDTITKEKLQTILAMGADRISVNPQTLEDTVLQTIGRRHTAQQAIDAFHLAREVGCKNINMDLIAGLPGDTPEGFRRTLNGIFQLNPDSITVHTLTLKRAAALFASGSSQIDNPVEEMVQDSILGMAKHNYLPYYMYRQKNTIDNLENVGYARPGKESLYNILIMDESQPIFGAGCAASTKLIEPCGRITRIHNYKFPYEYIRNFDQLMEKKQQVMEIYASIREQEQAGEQGKGLDRIEEKRYF